MTDVLELDTAQRAAASVDPADRQIVMAGPGAGKSEVVGALARHLVDEGVHPQAILVIAFSRAAVDVVSRRTEDIDDQGTHVDVATIDSLAARVIRDLAEDAPQFLTHDRNIEFALQLLSEADDSRLFDDVDHVIVDEIQDVVGVRAHFVEALLTRGVRDDTGFTLLGDPIQSIYGFAEKDVNARTAEPLLARLQRRFRPTSRELRGDHRSRTADARKVGTARADLLRLTGEDRLRRVRALLSDLSPLGELDDEVIADLRGWRGTTALLCETNARAALVAERCATAGLPVETAESTAHPALPSWLAEVLEGPAEGTVTRDQFFDAAERTGARVPDSAWTVLVSAADSRRGLDVRRLADRLRGRTRPLGLARRPDSDIVASTVHRAKGLEFDNVVMIDPDAWTHPKSDPDDDARLLFVAASRARGRLTIARGPATKGWAKGPWGRWDTRPYPGARPVGTLLTPADLWPTSVPAEEVPVGTPVMWERADRGHLDAEGRETPAWNAVADGRTVAVTGDDLGRYLKAQSQVDRLRLEGGRVLGFETRIITGPGGELAFRLMPRIAGPLTWKRI